LYDSRFGDGDVKDIRRYIKYGPLGQAFASDKRVVLLIDEVDKADVEFPNDLLHELDRMRFTVSETGDEIDKFARTAWSGPQPTRGELLTGDSAQGVGFIVDGTSTKACRGRAVDASSGQPACPGGPGKEQVRSWHLAY